LILVTGHIRVPLDNLEALRPHIRTLVAETRKEDGCLLYAFAEDLNEPGVIRIVERWRDWPALEAHGMAPHMAPFKAVMAGAGVVSREVLAHAAGEEKVL
jgi:quinol monooxygenase YgiN